MKRFTSFILVATLFIGAGLSFSGCYKARVTTDAEPSAKKIEKSWATGFLFGLATPGANINSSNRCENGVAVVESKLSFLNMLASQFTFGIYTPMSVTVTCAEGEAMGSVFNPSPMNISPEYELEQLGTAETMTTAATKSAISQEPVKVRTD